MNRQGPPRPAPGRLPDGRPDPPQQAFPPGLHRPPALGSGAFGGDPTGQPKAMFQGRGEAGGEGWPGSGARPGRPPAGLHGPEGRGPPPPAPLRPEGPPREDPGGVRRAPGPPGRRPHPGGGDRRRGTRGARAPLPRPGLGLGGTLAPGAGVAPPGPRLGEGWAPGEILSLRSPLRPRNRGKKAVPTGTPAPTLLGSRSLPSCPRGEPPLQGPGESPLLESFLRPILSLRLSFQP